MSDKILVKYKVLEDIGDNINSLNDIIGNAITQIRKLGYQWQFDGLDRLEHPEINKLEENMDSLLHKGGNTPEKLKELEMDLKRVVQKFYDADYQGVNVNIAPDGSNMFGPKAPLPDNPNAKIKETEHTGIANAENKVRGVLEKGAILGPGLLMANDFVYGIANNGSTLLRGKDLDNQVKTDLDRQDAFVSEVKDVGGMAVGSAVKAADVAGETLDGVLGSNLEKDGYEIVKTKTTETTNAEWAARGYDQPPATPGTQSYVVKAGDNQYARFFSIDEDGDSNIIGRWIMRKSDIDGLSSADIVDKYALPEVPNNICDVNFPKNLNLEVSEANGLPQWGHGGGIQFDTMDENLEARWFSNPRNFNK